MVSLVINLTRLFPNGNNFISIWKQTGRQGEHITIQDGNNRFNNILKIKQKKLNTPLSQKNNLFWQKNCIANTTVPMILISILLLDG